MVFVNLSNIMFAMNAFIRKGTGQAELLHVGCDGQLKECFPDVDLLRMRQNGIVGPIGEELGIELTTFQFEESVEGTEVSKVMLECRLLNMTYAWKWGIT